MGAPGATPAGRGKPAGVGDETPRVASRERLPGGVEDHCREGDAARGDDRAEAETHQVAGGHHLTAGSSGRAIGALLAEVGSRTAALALVGGAPETLATHMTHGMMSTVGTGAMRVVDAFVTDLASDPGRLRPLPAAIRAGYAATVGPERAQALAAIVERDTAPAALATARRLLCRALPDELPLTLTLRVCATDDGARPDDPAVR